MLSQCFLWLLIALTFNSSSPATADLQSRSKTAGAKAIACHFAYRSAPREGMIVKDVFLKENESAEVEQGDFVVTTKLVLSRFEASSLLIQLKLKNSAKISSQELYQFRSVSDLQNSFSGGHGFTGLNYRYSLHSEAELQYWCTAD